MQTPSKDNVKLSEKEIHLIRHSAYNGGVSEKVTWQVCRKYNDSMWKLLREFNTKKDAISYMQAIKNFS